MKLNKIYKNEIFIPENVEIQKKQSNLRISGLLGSTILNLEKLDNMGVVSFNLNNNLPFSKNEISSDPLLNLAKKPQEVLHHKKQKNLILHSNHKPFLKSISNIIKNKITGVSSGFLISIRIIGVGYRAEIIKKKKQVLLFKIGFSHDFEYVIPASIRVFLVEPTLICLYGVDKNQITQIAAKIREIKPPSVYKGKGIKLVNENVFLKPGKRK